MRSIYEPAMRPVPPPCGQDCKSRAPGCSAMCCTWTLYLSIRERIYSVNHRAKTAMEENQSATREITAALKKQRRYKLYASK